MCVVIKHSLICVQGFDEYMNIVLDEAAEVNTKTNVSSPIGEGVVVTSFMLF